MLKLCPLYKSETIQDIFAKLGTDEIMVRQCAKNKTLTPYIIFKELCYFIINSIESVLA